MNGPGATATRYLEAGGYFWNSGIFLLPAEAFIAEVERLQPAVLAACRRSLELARADLDFLRLDEKAFQSEVERQLIFVPLR